MINYVLVEHQSSTKIEIAQIIFQIISLSQA